MRKIELCGGCAAVLKEHYNVRRVGGGVNNKVVCGQCGKRRFGGTYELTAKKKERG